MKIAFDIKHRPQIESGEYKVETRDGQKVRVLCYDANNTLPVVVLATFNNGSEGPLCYYSNGTMISDRESPLDLFIVTPEPEMSEFEKAVDAIYESCNVKELRVKDKAAELLELARKELDRITKENIAKDERFVSHKYSLNPYEIGVKDGYKAGKEDALKDLPRWKKCEHEMHTLTNLLIRSIDAMWIGAYVKEGQYYIPTNDLILKLPGFKEDESHE